MIIILQSAYVRVVLLVCYIEFVYVPSPHAELMQFNCGCDGMKVSERSQKESQGQEPGIQGDFRLRMT